VNYARAIETVRQIDAAQRADALEQAIVAAIYNQGLGVPLPVILRILRTVQRDLTKRPEADI
jgi:hypothetical protein